jgi:hypothetical protein
MKPKTLLYLSLLSLLFKSTLSFGNDCKQLINEHFFDLNELESPQDYLYMKQNEDSSSTQIYFNFCRSVVHSCQGTEPQYHMMVTNGDSCTYYKTIQDNIDYGEENGGNNLYLVSKTDKKVGDGVLADGIASLFQGNSNTVSLTIQKSQAKRNL